MRSTETILGVIREHGRQGKPMKRVMSFMYNVNLYLAAYGRLYRNKGAMTKGTTDETVDGMSLAKIEAIIQSLKDDTFQWTPARRTYIPKKSGKRRPLGIPTWKDKLVQEVVRMILDAYYDVQFSDASCGFRTGRGCHTALSKILHQWPATAWFIEGDIAKCFDRLDHQVLLDILRESFHDQSFLRLIEGLLRAGYLEDWKFNQTLSGTPQGGVVSPILSNIYLDRLDKYVESTLIPTHTKGKNRRINPPYHQLENRALYLREHKRQEEAQAVKDQMRKLPSIDPNDPNFRRLRYVRYADDFLLGFIGPKEEAEDIKAALETFLRDNLKLELSRTKTLITHARTECAAFLGYEVQTTQDDTKLTQVHRKNGKTYKQRSINGRIGLKIPERVIKEKGQQFMRRGKPTSRTERTILSEYEIVRQYQAEYAGLVNYYRMAYNLSTQFNKLEWIMETSLTMTLSHKLKKSIREVYRQFRVNLDRDGKPSRGLQAIYKREGKKPLTATWGGISLKWNEEATLNDKPKKPWAEYSELIERLLIGECEYCGASPVEVHHIHALKDIDKVHSGRIKPEWQRMMIARQRKTLVVCHTCHMDIQYGYPMRNAKSERGFMQNPKGWRKPSERTAN